MSTKVTATALRADLYRILDEVLTTGTPVEIERRGRILYVAERPPPPLRDLAHLPPQPSAMVCTADELIEPVYVPTADPILEMMTPPRKTSPRRPS